MKITIKGLAYDKCSVNDSYMTRGGGSGGGKVGEAAEEEEGEGQPALSKGPSPGGHTVGAQ